MHDALIQALAEIDRPGEVCCSGDLPMTMPGLVVENFGVLRLPLGDLQARELIGCCQQAPFGKGAQTLVDTTVRRVWELDAECVQFTNPKWKLFIDSLVGEVQQKLGLESHKLIAHFYKLLVYEKGSFFLPHQDGEKLKRMVATLVVVLPSTHEGGALIVSHDGHQHEITFSGAASGCELSYAAFYADCLHEVRPLASGYRLCLTYNLTLAKSRRTKAITAPSYEQVVGKIGTVLDGWRNKPDSQKLAILLDHRYTRDGLTLEALKGTYRAQAQVLFKAAKSSHCVAHLALITLWQHGTAECYAEDYSYRRKGNYRSWENDDGVGDEYEMGEIFDTLLSANYWSDAQGKMVPIGEIYLDEAEIVTNTELDAGKPSEEDYEGYTGNAGMTLERWYHRAAVVIWPYEKNLAVLCKAGTDAAIGGLKSMVDRLKLASKADQPAQFKECQALASLIVDTWQPAQEWQSRGQLLETERNVFVKLLCGLDNSALVRRLLSKVLPVDGEIKLDAAFIKLCRRHDWPEFEADLLGIIKAARLDTLLRNAQ